MAFALRGGQLAAGGFELERETATVANRDDVRYAATDAETFQNRGLDWFSKTAVGRVKGKNAGRAAPSKVSEDRFLVPLLESGAAWHGLAFRLSDRERVAEFDGVTAGRNLFDEVRVMTPERIFGNIIELGGFDDRDLSAKCEPARGLCFLGVIVHLPPPTCRRGHMRPCSEGGAKGARDAKGIKLLELNVLH
jgi:hypothetical protein